MRKKEAETGCRTQKRSIVFPIETLEQLETLAAKDGVFVSTIVRDAVDKRLDIQSYTDNISLITSLIHQELDISIRAQTNRLAALINRLTIIAAAGYYASIATVADLIDSDRYSSFEKIERIARRRALLYANSKSSEGIREFLDDEEIEKIKRELTGAPEKKTGEKRKRGFESFDPAADDPNDFDFG